MTTRSQKRNAVAELVSGDFETSIAENNTTENLVAGPNKHPRIEHEYLKELKTSLRREIMTGLTKLLAENQKEMLKLIAPLNKNHPVCPNIQDSDSEAENISVARTSAHVKSNTATISKTTPVNSRNLVTGFLNDSTNQPTKRPNQDNRPSTSKILFAPQPQTFPTANLLPMPKALTASLPVFDGKSEKLELFEDLFRNNIKMYPHLTGTQKINYFHSLLRGNALQAYCNLDGTKKDNLEEVITAFKRRFGDFQSSAKARCGWDAVHFDPTKQKLHEFLDILQKTAKEAFGSEAQRFIDKAIYAKMPDHVKKILNRAYLEDKPYNDIVLHLEREMRLNGLGLPDETTLVPLNSVDAVVTEDKKEQQQRGYCFHCEKYGHYKAQCRRLRKERYYATKASTAEPKQTEAPKPKCDTCGKLHKTDNCWGGANAANDPRKKETQIHHPNQQNQRTTRTHPVRSAQKFKSPRLRFGEKVDARAYAIEDPPNRYEEDFLTECNEEPTQVWQRRWNVGMILRHNARHPENPTPLPKWKTESPDNYATLKRPLPESKTERIYIYNRDYRCDPWDEPTIYDTNKLSFKIQVPNPQAQSTEITNLPSPLSPILKRTTPTVPVTITSTQIDAENIICIEDKAIWPRQTREQRENTAPPSPSTQTAPATAMTAEDKGTTECPPALPEDLDAIKEFIQHDKNNDYIPLMSAIALKKKKRMLFLPVEFNAVKNDALVDSGAYINAISERDAEKLGQNASQCIVNRAPPFKMQYANAELEQPLATYTLRFKIGDYTFEETFIILTQTSFPIIGLAFLRKHAAILDTAQGTIDFPKIQITMALTDERQKRNLEPIMIKTEAKHTIPAHPPRTIYASIPVSTEHPITDTIQPLPQFDECAKMIVAPAITTARDKKVPIKIANTTDLPYTMATDTKVAQLQILKPEETKLIRPVDIAALNLLTEQDDVVTYINALMQVERPEDNEEKFWFPTPENPGKE